MFSKTEALWTLSFGVFMEDLLQSVKGEMKWGHSCQGVLKGSWGAIEKIGLCMSSLGKTMNIWTRPYHKYSKDSAWKPTTCYCKRLGLVTNYILPRLVFCHQCQSKLFVNSIYKYSLLSLKTFDFCFLGVCVQGGTIGVAGQIFFPTLQLWDPQMILFLF